MTTLSRERRQRFEAIIKESELYFMAFDDDATSDDEKDGIVSRLATALADAAASRTEAQEKPMYSIGSEQLSWELYNAIKDTKYIGKATRTKMREVLEEKLGKEETMRNKQWDLAHDFPADLAPMVEKLERALGLRNMKRDDRAVEVYRWVLEQEAAGQTVQKFAEWAKMPERVQFIGKYKNNPEAIQRDWALAFEVSEVKKGGYDEVRF